MGYQVVAMSTLVLRGSSPEETILPWLWPRTCVRPRPKWHLDGATDDALLRLLSSALGVQ
jgi:hypothetical protein